MNKRNIIYLAMMGLFLSTFLFSCKKFNYPKPVSTSALFSYKSDGYTITFTNKSSVSGTYLWNFGDGSTSTKPNPVHTYDSSASYLVTLAVTTSKGNKYNVFTRINVSKKTWISLTDNSFSDWAKDPDKIVVPYNDTVQDAVKAAMFDYDGNWVYVYVEYTGVTADVFDIEMDNYVNDSTGNTSWMWPKNFAAQYLIEGQLAVKGAVISPFIYNGTNWPNDQWAWASTAFPAGFFQLGYEEVSGDTTRVEFGISRTKVPGLSNKKVKWGIFLSNPVSWQDVGHIPLPGGPALTLDLK